MEFRLRGVLEAWRGATAVALGRRRGERLLLGLLLLEAGRVVAVDRLLDLLWDGHPPDTAHATLHTHLARLRAVVDPDRDGGSGIRLVRRGDGYLAEIDPERVDVHRFRSLVLRGRERADPVERSATLAQALALWRGPLLAGLASDRLRDRIGTGLQELRLTACEMRVEADLACGRHHDVIPTLAEFVREHPLRERLIGSLMLALYRDGRRTDALDTYRRATRHLAEEYGLDPGRDLDQLHQRMLRDEPALAAPPPADLATAEVCIGYACYRVVPQEPQSQPDALTAPGVPRATVHDLILKVLAGPLPGSYDPGSQGPCCAGASPQGPTPRRRTPDRAIAARRRVVRRHRNAQRGA